MATKTLKQSTFIWEGKDKRGEKVQGESPGQTVGFVKANLRRQGINPTKVKKKATPLFGSGGGKPVTAKDIAIFSRQLAVMMSAGVPIVQAFDIIGRGHENKRMREMLLSIKADIEGGNTLSGSLAKYPLHFDTLYCSLVSAGEHAGILDTLLGEIAAYKEKTEAIKGKIKKALFYPTAVIVVAFIVIAILMIFVVPQFAQLFAGFGANLPAPTLIVVAISNFFVAWWWVIFGAIGGSIYLLIYFKKRSKAFQHFLDRTMLKIPVIGTILRKAALARFSRTLSTMFAAGVPLVDAMESVAGAVGNIVYSNTILKMRDEVTTGTQLNVAMRQARLYPNMVVQMTAIGEEAGSLDNMLAKVADFYEEEVDNAVDSLSSLMEPMIMAFLGVVIGGLVIAMYMPIFEMGKVVSQ